MLKYVYSIYDSKARTYSNPFITVHPDVAVRDFTRAVNDPQLDLFKFSGDFTLVQLGTFDDEIAVINTHENPLIIGIGATYKE